MRKPTFNGNKITVSIRLPKDLVKFYKDYSKKYGQKFSFIIADALDQVATDVKGKL